MPEIINIDNQQSIELAITGYLRIRGITYLKKARYDNLLQAEPRSGHGDLIAQNHTAVFILSPNTQNYVPTQEVFDLPTVGKG